MTQYLTIQDAYEHLVDVFDHDGKDTGRLARSIRRAVAEAYRRFPSLHPWAWLTKQAMITTSAPYTTGTVTYVASTRALTLSGGTWPTDAEFGMVEISSVRYSVERRNSSTVLTLSATQAPAEDIASATTYRWGRYTYLLPYGCTDIRELTDPKTLYRFYRQTVDDSFFQTEIPGVNRFPSAWTIVPSVQRPGRMELALTAVPDTARTLKFLYDAQWGNPSVTELSTGTVSVSGDVATFSSSILTDDCVGAVLRIGSSTTKPTSVYGVFRGADGHVTELPASTHIITQVNSATEAIIETSGSTVSGKAFTISSRVDVDENSMWDLFLRIAELAYRRITRADSKLVQESERIMRTALIEAQIADAKRLPEQSMGTTIAYRPVIIE